MDDSTSSKKRVPDVKRLRIVGRARKLFDRLRASGTERDIAGNRRLLFSHYASLVLLGMFNPALQTLRGLQEASQLKKVQKRLGTGRVSLGSLSESSTVFDPNLLLPMIEELLADLPIAQTGPGPRRTIPDTIPRELAERLVAVDGSTLNVLPQIARSATGGSWKLHLQFRPLRGLPGSAVLQREYQVDERDVLVQELESGCVYIADRGYEQYALYNRIVQAKSDYVIRGQDRPAEIVERRTVSEKAVAARVVTDDIVRLGPKSRSSPVAVVDHAVRRIVISKRDQGRVRSDRNNSDQVILYTNLLDVPAEVIAAVYELRWSIELFFRFLKQVLGCEQLFSDKSNSAAIQVYIALIACLLLAHATGGRITMRTYRMIGFYLQGLADDDELNAEIRRIRGKGS